MSVVVAGMAPSRGGLERVELPPAATLTTSAPQGGRPEAAALKRQ